MDPRITISAEDLQLQTDYSVACYKAYHQLQDIREAIDQKLAGKVSDEQRKTLQTLRGNGSPGGGDILYGSITETPAERETVVALQEKFLHMLTVLQSADARPTPQAMQSVQRLQEIMGAVMKRWEGVK